MDRQLRTRFAAAIRWPKLCANLTGAPGSQAPSAPDGPAEGFSGVTATKSPQPDSKQGCRQQGGNDIGLKLGRAARLTFVDVGAPGWELRTDFLVGTHNRLGAEHYYRVGTKFFIAPGGSWSQRTQDYYGRGRPSTFRIQTPRTTWFADLGYSLGHRSKVRMGYQVGYIRPSVSSGNPEIEPVEGMTGGARVTLAYDGMDNLVPKKRIRFNFDGRDEPLASWAQTVPHSGIAARVC